MARYEKHENTSAHWKTGQHVSEIIFEGTSAELERLRQLFLTRETATMIKELRDLDITSLLRVSPAIAS
jgi:hypothetical protein